MAVEDELRKRLGSRFTIAELARLYRESGDAAVRRRRWRRCRRARISTDLSAACDAAFYLYMREAADFAGGRRIPRAAERPASRRSVAPSGSSAPGSSSRSAGPVGRRRGGS